jgi:hypothetical protein
MHFNQRFAWLCVTHALQHALHTVIKCPLAGRRGARVRLGRATVATPFLSSFEGRSGAQPACSLLQV